MKFRKIGLPTLIWVLLTVVSGCTPDDIDSSFANQKRESADKTNKIELEEALIIADNIFDALNVPSTRAGRFIEQVETIESVKTRTSDSLIPDTLLYLVNYANNGGFALLAADRRIAPVFAISEEGHMELSDTCNNPGLNLFINSVMDEILCEDCYRPEIDGIATTPNYIADDNYTFRRKTYNVYYPLLTKEQRLLNQSAPFNSYIPKINNQTPPAGCVPVALATLLSYYKYPTEWDNYSFDWDAIHEDCKHPDMQKLLYILGKPENLNVNYGVSASSAASINCLKVLRKLGYETPDNLIPFDVDSVFYNLKEVRNIRGAAPIYVEGFRIDSVNNTTPGHAWVIDGALKNKNSSGYIPQDQLKDYHMFHCIWGWGGTNNGYFRFTTSKGFDPNSNSFDKDDPKTRIPMTRHYCLWIKMFGFVKPPHYRE